MNQIKNIFVDGTAKTPQIDFNRFSGELIISGRSVPENAAKIYKPLLDWIAVYIKSPRPTTNFRLDLEAFNSTSSKWFTRIIKVLSKINKDGYVLYVHKYFNIEYTKDLEMDEIRDFVSLLADNIGNTSISIGVKAYGTEKSGKIVKESMILI
jgi:hypothetical protein